MQYLEYWLNHSLASGAPKNSPRLFVVAARNNGIIEDKVEGERLLNDTVTPFGNPRLCRSCRFSSDIVPSWGRAKMLQASAATENERINFITNVMRERADSDNDSVEWLWTSGLDLWWYYNLQVLGILHQFIYLLRRWQLCACRFR